MLLGQQAAAQDLQRLILILELAAFVLALHHHSGGDVRDPDGAGRFVDVLAARTRGAEGIDAQILGVDDKIHLFGLRHHRHGCRGGVDAALRFGLGHTLDTVHSALILEPVIGPCAVHGKNGFLDTAQLRLIEVQNLQLPAPALNVHGVHPHQAVGKQRGFFAARTAAQLHDDTFIIVDILGQQQNFEIIFQLRHFLTFFADLLLYHFLKVRIKGLALEQGFGLSKMILRRGQGLISLHHGFRLVILLHQTAEQCGICRCFRLVQADGKFFKPVADSLHLGKQS